jgi:predicted acylesterase/phospholipase RssA
MAVSSATYLKKKKCDIFWEPDELAKFKVFDYKKSKELFNIGYQYARKQIDSGALKKLGQLNEVR